MTVVSRWAERRMRNVAPGATLELLPCGVDAARFQPGIDGRAIRDEYRLGDGPVIVTVSRLVPRKGHDRIIRALRSVAREFPAVRLFIVGAGPSRRHLERLAARERVLEHVIFAGEVSRAHLPACFAAGDVFAMPCRSRWAGLDVEGLGSVFLQAAAIGLPAIAGTSGGAPEAVLDGRTGLVVDGTSVPEVEAALLRLLRSPREARAFGAAGAARVHQEMTWSLLARRLGSLLYEASAERHHGLREGAGTRYAATS
jgi:phosphatidylinositol alpha-1,6-mannosyltransferase